MLYFLVFLSSCVLYLICRCILKLSCIFGYQVWPQEMAAVHFLQLVWYHISAPNFASWEHLNVSAGPFYTTWKTLKLSGCHKHIFLFCSSNKQLCPTVIDFPNKSTWSSSLAKYAFSGTQQMEFPQAQFCKKCECVYMCVCIFLSYYLYCANFFDLGDSGCELMHDNYG